MFVVMHSPFVAIVGVFDQLDATPGSILGPFGLLKWLRDLDWCAGSRSRARGLGPG